MTHAEYYRELTKYALGWLGWTERQALAADINSIQLAIEGKVEMLKLIHFPGKGQKPKESKASFADRFKEFTKTHNAIMKGRTK